MDTSRSIRLSPVGAVVVVVLAISGKTSAILASSGPRATPPDGFVGKIFGPDVITYQTTYVDHPHRAVVHGRSVHVRTSQIARNVMQF